MRPINQDARDRLDAVLRANAPASAADLAKTLGVSVPTLLRMLKEQGLRVVRIGATKSARYALRRPLRGMTNPIPVYRVDEQGRGHNAGALDLIQPEGSVLDLQAMGWPTDQEHRFGRWEGLPYPLYDMQPQGFLGRGFARRHHADLMVPSNPQYCADENIVWALCRLGSDTPGSLSIGNPAYARWLASIANPDIPVSGHALAAHYADLANLAASLGVEGSSAAGEFPKFTASRERVGSSTPQVIVKFSGAEPSSTVRRWADLLVCEHLALVVLEESAGIPAARSRILEASGRTFFEVERFDRHGAFGRSASVTLDVLNVALIGGRERAWPDLVGKLVTMKLAPADIAESVRVLWWFGKLIGNTDMHLGNLSFRLAHAASSQVGLALTPAYDMLPMLYAPFAGGEIPMSVFSPELPWPREREAWVTACKSALSFWRNAGEDSRISEPFRAICRDNWMKLSELSDRA